MLVLVLAAGGVCTVCWVKYLGLRAFRVKDRVRVKP